MGSSNKLGLRKMVGQVVHYLTLPARVKMEINLVGEDNSWSSRGFRLLG